MGWKADPIPVSGGEEEALARFRLFPPRHWRDFVLVVAILRNCFSRNFSSRVSPRIRLLLSPDTTHSRQTCTCGFSLKAAARNEVFSFLSSYVSSFKIYVNSTNNQPQVSMFLLLAAPIHLWLSCQHFRVFIRVFCTWDSLLTIKIYLAQSFFARNTLVRHGKAGTWWKGVRSGRWSKECSLSWNRRCGVQNSSQ